MEAWRQDEGFITRIASSSSVAWQFLDKIECFGRRGDNNIVGRRKTVETRKRGGLGVATEHLCLSQEQFPVWSLMYSTIASAENNLKFAGLVETLNDFMPLFRSAECSGRIWQSHHATAVPASSRSACLNLS